MAGALNLSIDVVLPICSPYANTLPRYPACLESCENLCGGNKNFRLSVYLSMASELNGCCPCSLLVPSTAAGWGALIVVIMAKILKSTPQESEGRQKSKTRRAWFWLCSLPVPWCCSSFLEIYDKSNSIDSLENVINGVLPLIKTTVPCSYLPIIINNFYSKKLLSYPWFLSKILCLHY